MPTEFPSIPALKAEARALRADAVDRPFTLVQALEHIATRYGVRDWNMLVAMAPDAPCWSDVGVRVTGRYLGQPLAGKIHACGSAKAGAAYAVTIAFDEPVDVVAFASFSNLRSRVSCVVDAAGHSTEVTSDGVAHMQIDPRAR